MKTMLPDLLSRNLMADPFRNFDRDFFGRELFNRDLANLLGQPAEAQGAAAIPAMNIAETENAIEATLELPGVDEKDIKVRVEGNRLIISGEKNWESRRDEKDWHVVERRFGAFNRSVLLPFEPATDAISANYDKGVLHLQIMKPIEKSTAAKTIPVMSGAPKAPEPTTSH